MFDSSLLHGTYQSSLLQGMHYSKVLREVRLRLILLALQVAPLPSSFDSVEHLATSLLWLTVEEVRAGLQQEVEAQAGSSASGPQESPLFIRNVRGDTGACDRLLRGRRGDNALLTTIEVSAAMPCSALERMCSMT